MSSISFYPCPKCGSPNPWRAKFCNQCATPLTPPNESAARTRVDSANVTQPPKYPPHTNPLQLSEKEFDEIVKGLLSVRSRERYAAIRAYIDRHENDPRINNFLQLIASTDSVNEVRGAALSALESKGRGANQIPKPAPTGGELQTKGFRGSWERAGSSGKIGMISCAGVLVLGICVIPFWLLLVPSNSHPNSNDASALVASDNNTITKTTLASVPRTPTGTRSIVSATQTANTATPHKATNTPTPSRTPIP